MLKTQAKSLPLPAIKLSHTQKSHASSADEISGLAESNRRLAESLDKSEAVNRLKTAFLATVSHELKTPLNGIIGFSDLITMEYPNSSAGEFSRLINESGQKLLTLVNRMLELTEIEADEAAVSISPGSVIDLLEGLLQEFADYASSKGVLMSMHPAQDTALIIHTDICRLRNVLGTLIDNAIRYMDKENGLIEISAMSDEHGFLFRVTDNGPGIPPGSERLIFDKFRQLDNFATRRNEGLGLGLALARSQVTMLGGTLGLIRLPEQTGACFEVRIPSKNTEAVF